MDRESIDQDREILHHRLSNKKKSHSAENAWRRHHGDFMQGVRKRERKKDNSMVMSIKDINEKMSQYVEAEELKDNVFNNDYSMAFETIAGGIALNINPDNANISISVALNDEGSGSYKLINAQNEDDYKNLYDQLKEELTNICNKFDDEVRQLLSKHGLSSTK